jgi:aspartate oxidase
MHFAADITGAEIMRTMRDEARNMPDGIQVLEFSPAVELVLNEHGHCGRRGAVQHGDRGVLRGQGQGGGDGHRRLRPAPHPGLHDHQPLRRHRRRHRHGYRAGVPVAFLHTVQYHPTGIVFPEQAEGILITEKFRGSGANLVNIEGNQFVNEREPRDVEAASIIKECTHDGLGVPTPTGRLGSGSIRR